MKIFKLFLVGIITLIIGFPLMAILVAILNGAFIGLFQGIFESVLPASFMIFKLAGGIESISEPNFIREIVVLTIVLLVVVLELVNSIKPKEIKNYKEMVEDEQD